VLFAIIKKYSLFLIATPKKEQTVTNNLIETAGSNIRSNKKGGELYALHELFYELLHELLPIIR
jgi:hypothetical protein